MKHDTSSNTTFTTCPAELWGGCDYIIAQQRAEALHEASKRVHRERRAAASKAKQRRERGEVLKPRDVRSDLDGALFPAMEDDGADGSRMLAAGGAL